MIIQFIKNIHFTRLIKTNGRLREFNFRKIPNETPPLFHVDVCDDRNNRIIFFTRKTESGEWKISDMNIPHWIKDVESILHQMIEEEIKSVQSQEE